MKRYNKNRQKFNVQLSDGTNNISFEQMWALNQASKSPGFISNPLAKAYSNAFVSGGQILQGIGGIASAVPIPGVAIGGAALSMLGGLIDKPAAQKPTYGTETTTRYGMATGGSMEPISPNAMEVTGAPNQTDGNQINYKGQPINVDHGEVIDHSKDIVFSDKLFDPRSGKSFADTVKPMEKLIGKLSKMPSNINNNTIKALEQQKQKVFQTQEQVAAALGQRNSDGSTVQPGQPAMAMGGKINSYVTGGRAKGRKYYRGDPGNPIVNLFKDIGKSIGYGALDLAGELANTLAGMPAKDRADLQARIQAQRQAKETYSPKTTITAKRITPPTQSSKNYVTTGVNKFPIVSMMRAQNNVQTTPNTVTPKSSRNTTSTRGISVPPSSANEFRYAKGYTDYASLDLRPDEFNKYVNAFLESDEGQKYQRIQRAKDPNWKFWGKNQAANNTIGPKYAELLDNPEFQKFYKTPYNEPPTEETRLGQQFGSDPTSAIQETFGYNVTLPASNKRSVPGYANDAQDTYNAERERARLAGTTSDDSEENKRPGSEPFDAKGAINQFFKDNPNSAQPLKKPSKFGLGDYLQLGAAGASVLGALFDKPEKQRPNLDKTQITQNRYDPANALMQNQYTTNAGMMANTNNYSSAGVQAGLQNLMANKYKADSQVQSQYDQMNNQARTQYEQRLQQQNQFNAQVLSANDDKNVANRAAYTNNLYGALQTVSNVGKGFNQKATSEKAINALIANDPQAAQGFLDANGQVDQTALEKNKQLGQMVYQTIDGKYFNADGTEYKKPTGRWSGGKIKLRKRR
ncbi:hypothetical protein EKK58_07685 [Candidatus Dependentiae bacterium]|nr:MAG: hypothetical protein EKK58_07685 [Candidatus Dependentiae bacterium]